MTQSNLIPADYIERVYAGVLGKIIGVYLGRPFEQWSHTRIMKELGEINYYVHDRLGVPLIVSDDDITGTFTFIRALEDYNYSPELTARQIGQSWLNYIIENKTILWWGGMGMSTEHTAYLRLKAGIPAPRSGSIELNSKVVAEQIGSQIFIDGWAMVAPGNPDLAVELATKAASVSHDGEAIHGAVVIAAMESLAFIESDLNKLLDAAVKYIPTQSAIYQLIADLRQCRAKESDWHKGLALIHEKYNYEKFGGGCHMVPNHAVIMLGLLWGDDNFQRSLMIANTAGYDTDCNSGNVGCLLGIKNGLKSIDAGPDWRGPVADRLILPTADGGRCISDAVTETYHLARAGMALVGKKLEEPKNGSRFHFALPGSVQGFAAETPDTVTVRNCSKQKALALHYHHLATGQSARVATQTFISSEQAKRTGGYDLVASPTLYPGQTVTAVASAPSPVRATLYVRYFDHTDKLALLHGPSMDLQSNSSEIRWRLPAVDGQPIAEVGLELTAIGSLEGTAYLHSLTWSGSPDVVLKKPDAGGTMWTKAWVDGTNQPLWWAGEAFCQNTGRGMLTQGTREWTDYRVATDITPHMVKAAGIAARVQGMQRYYGLLLCNDSTIKLVKMLDGETILASKPFKWEFTRTYAMALEVSGNQIKAFVNGAEIFSVTDHNRPLTGGAIGILCEEGRGKRGPVTVQPV